MKKQKKAWLISSPPAGSESWRRNHPDDRQQKLMEERSSRVDSQGYERFMRQFAEIDRLRKACEEKERRKADEQDAFHQDR